MPLSGQTSCRRAGCFLPFRPRLPSFPPVVPSLQFHEHLCRAHLLWPSSFNCLCLSRISWFSHGFSTLRRRFVDGSYKWSNFTVMQGQCIFSVHCRVRAKSTRSKCYIAPKRQHQTRILIAQTLSDSLAFPAWRQVGVESPENFLIHHDHKTTDLFIQSLTFTNENCQI